MINSSTAATAAALLLAGGGALLLAARRDTAGNVEAGPDDLAGTISLQPISDTIEAAMNRITEQPANVASTTATANVRAFLQVIQQAEGTLRPGIADPYRVVYGYAHTITDLRDHPAETGEWRGVRLSDGMCQRAGFGPGCISTAAGAYQIIRPTWRKLRAALRLADFTADSQDRAAIELIRQRGALADVQAGRFAAAVHKCRQEWASLPGNSAGQGQRALQTLAAWYEAAGGGYA